MDISNVQKRSMMSFIVIAFFGVGATVFLIGKASDAANEMELLNNGPLAVRRAALAQALGEGAASSSVGAVNTSNWKTYRNEKYGFEVRYPEDMTIEIGSSSIKNAIAKFWIYDPTYRPPEDAVGQEVRHEFREISMDIYPFSSERLRGMEENNFKTDKLGQHVWSRENIKIGNGAIEAYIMNSGLIGPYFSALLYNNIYILNVYTAYGDNGDFAQSILSTFKFAK